MVRRLTPKQYRRPLVRGGKVYVGCGDKRREGYLGCDIRALPTVDLVSKAWQLSWYCRDLEEIYSRHMLEHLTYGEVEVTLDDWFQALAMGGRVHLVVPNLDFHIAQWFRAEWTESSLAERQSDARWSLAGFYGWQRECDPRQRDYTDSYWDVHKSGYNEKLMRFLLARAGYSNIRIWREDGGHLVAQGEKCVNKGERQVGPTLAQIRLDHRSRYEFAARLVPRQARVLDAACGVGYGTKILAETSGAREIVGLDIHQGTIEYAREHYPAENVQYQQGDVLETDWPDEHYDVAVSFETIEHIADACRFLQRVHRALKADGILVCSTPNQEQMPFDPKKFPYHKRHYTPAELSALLAECGFTVHQKHTQHDRHSGEIRSGWDGKYNIAVCRKAA
jgi:2-polyprenyl-3-methyl-5-hydroxy-6-metoxy-1,4-benzoquinol methylase